MLLDALGPNPMSVCMRTCTENSTKLNKECKDAGYNPACCVQVAGGWGIACMSACRTGKPSPPKPDYIKICKKI